MKKISLAAAALVASSVSFAAPIPSGEIHFTGDLVNAACAVDVNSDGQTVDLGQHRVAKFKKAGDMSGPVPFQINLVDCEAALVTKGVSIAFKGSTTATNPKLLVVGAGTSNDAAAQGVGIQILDSSSTALTLDGTGFTKETALNDGTNSFRFSARYVSTVDAGPTLTAGKANADATFVVNYN
ncbi:type 1 fimbrial major subunit FimA [Acinetobacter bereziniae]|uniref:type 1 fimbrial major subunit FimA n=1 Tax=Acinetobacter bereziniae TaxID=106648 RepID=UPI0021D392E2|nr:type 1 fimbrial major subunit FimA [Acinetobacter bereziniae]MCU4313817.1 type 1 fimbrial major subunit FimA [Acinetobacter bereziniae]